MYSKNKDVNPRRNPYCFTHDRRGFTLPEMMISIVLAAIVLGMAASAMFTLATGSKSLINYSEMNTDSRFALESLGRNLRSAFDVLLAEPDELVIKRLDGAGNVEVIRYKLSADGKSFSVENIGTGESRVLLTDIHTLQLNYFTLRQAATTNELEVKHVQLESELIRDVLDMQNHNYIISARFMLRNRVVSN